MSDIKIKRIGILGCGWLGKPLAVSLISKGFLVNGSTTTVSKLASLEDVQINSFLVDISKNDFVPDFFKVDVFIIAITSKNIADFSRLITKLEHTAIKKIIFISSTSVYPSLNKVMTENDETTSSPLLTIENLFYKNTHFKTTIIRFAGLFGGERHPANWFQNKRKIQQPKGFVNMIHKDDCIAIINQIISQNCFGEIFNACSNHHPTRKEFYEYAKKVKGFEPPIFEENEVLNWKIISSEKLQIMLNYQFLVDNLFEAL